MADIILATLNARYAHCLRVFVTSSPTSVTFNRVPVFQI